MTVAKGGARKNSGPAADPKSMRSASRGLSLTALPAEGYSGEVPELSDFVPDPSAREEQLWAQYWRTPQACAWALEAWRWPTVADLVTHRARLDDPDAPGWRAVQVRQLRDDVGLSKAGLDHNGWAIARNQVGEKAAEKEAAAAPQPTARDRLTVVASDNAG